MAVLALVILSAVIFGYAVQREKRLAAEGGNFSFQGILIIPAVLVIVVLWIGFLLGNF